MEALCAWCQDCFEGLFSSDAIKSAVAEKGGDPENRKQLIERLQEKALRDNVISYGEKLAAGDASWSSSLFHMELKRQ